MAVTIRIPTTLRPLTTGQAEVEVEASINDRTGVEMEALAAVMGAALCVYDMCKAVDREMQGMFAQRLK